MTIIIVIIIQVMYNSHELRDDLMNRLCDVSLRTFSGTPL